MSSVSSLNSFPLMELLNSSSESILESGGGVAGSASCASGVFFLSGGPSEGVSWPSTSEAFRLCAVGVVVIYV